LAFFSFFSADFPFVLSFPFSKDLPLTYPVVELFVDAGLLQVRAPKFDFFSFLSFAVLL